MISLTRIKEAARGVIKVLRFGKSDVLNAEQFLPFGIDSQPIKDLQALHTNTAANDAGAIIGYLCRSELKNGETQIYAKDKNGDFLFYIYMRADGRAEFGGAADNLVRFAELDKALQNFKAEVNRELQSIATGIPLGSYTPVLTKVNIAGAKIDEILCP